MRGHEQLRQWRLGNEYSQTVAAELLDVSQGLYSGWECGNKTPGIVNLGWIRKITGISLEAWLPEELRLVKSSLAKARPRRTARPRAAA